MFPPVPPAAAALVALLAVLAAGPAAAQGQPLPESGHGRVAAAELIGRDVVGPDGDAVAEVADLIVEPDGTVARVVLDVGGFLGVGAKPVALEFGRLRIGPGGGDGAEAGISTTLTREQLEALPRFGRDKEGRYPAGPGERERAPGG